MLQFGCPLELVAGSHPRDANLIRMGTWIFKSSLGESDMQQILRPTVRHNPEQDCVTLRYTRPVERAAEASCLSVFPEV